jgi:hypothetical protein
MLCFVLRPPQTAVAKIQVKTATAAARTNTHLQTERQLENEKTFQSRRKAPNKTTKPPGQGLLLPGQNIILIDIAIGRGTGVDLPVRPSRPYHNSAMKSEIVASSSRIHQAVIT